jgi:hypothetical protein
MVQRGEYTDWFAQCPKLMDLALNCDSAMMLSGCRDALQQRSRSGSGSADKLLKININLWFGPMIATARRHGTA